MEARHDIHVMDGHYRIYTGFEKPTLSEFVLNLKNAKAPQN
ncbi:hypothetical protein [Shewanella gelidimarina]|nr:hypothetical protein [Shewanella gelidimarina]